MLHTHRCSKCNEFTSCTDHHLTCFDCIFYNEHSKKEKIKYCDCQLVLKSLKIKILTPDSNFRCAYHIKREEY